MSSIASPPVFKLAERSGNRLTLKSVDGHVAHIFVLEEDMVRVLVLPDGALRFPRTWAIAPGEEDVATEGRDRFDLAGFSKPEFKLAIDDRTLAIETKRLRLAVQLAGFVCRWEVRRSGVWHDALR